MCRLHLTVLVIGLAVVGGLSQVSAQAAFPNDPLFPSQWALRNAGAGGGTPGVDLRAPDAWRISRCSPAMKVAILASGVDATQPDLAGKVLPGASFVAGVSSGPGTDDGGAGTEMAGIVAAATNNGLGMAGLCPEGKILPVKVSRGDTQGTGANGRTVARGIAWAVGQGARVLALGVSTSNSRAIRQAVGGAWVSNAVVVAPTDGGDVIPADLPHVLAVDGMDKQGVLDHTITHGAENLVIAPDVGVVTTQLGGGYGTACACARTAAAQVAGVAALILSRRPDLTADQVIRAIERGAQPLSGQESKNSVQGYGRVDAYKALRIGRKMPVFRLSVSLNPAVLRGATQMVRGTTLRRARLTVTVTYTGGTMAIMQGRADQQGGFTLGWKVIGARGRATVEVTAATKSQGALVRTTGFVVR